MVSKGCNVSDNEGDFIKSFKDGTSCLADGVINMSGDVPNNSSASKGDISTNAASSSITTGSDNDGDSIKSSKEGSSFLADGVINMSGDVPNNNCASKGDISTNAASSSITTGSDNEGDFIKSFKEGSSFQPNGFINMSGGVTNNRCASKGDISTNSSSSSITTGSDNEEDSIKSFKEGSSFQPNGVINMSDRVTNNRCVSKGDISTNS